MTILFDLDGTLIDSTDAIIESFEVAYDSFGETPASKEEIKSLIGYPLDIMFEKLGIKGDKWEYVNAYKEHYRVISRAKTTLLPFAREAVEAAAKFATLGVVTTKTARYSQELLEHMEIMHHFKVLIGRENVENPKPHAEPILKAIQYLNALHDSTWMVGDTILDLHSAKSAGVKSVAVLCGYGEKQELAKHTDFIADNAYDAVQLIK
ncbi:HAD family hydrolase [Sulfurospirillum arcachonense]|uniref:HAD family hydrolase n=1 Tax=Sulfurospirillum arcachonense TaxID=57666 RepID=UPI000469D9E6|nr:HAD family hydrolase [Sulfurospirillum arcachonense]